MEITMSKNAVETLIEKVGENTKIALALINDSDPFLRDKVLLQKAAFSNHSFVSEFGEYATKIEHPLLDIYTSKLEQNYFGKRLNMDFNKQLDSFSLENEIAVLDYNIKLKNCFFS